MQYKETSNFAIKFAKKKLNQLIYSVKEDMDLFYQTKIKVVFIAS